MSPELLQSFLGWCAFINMCLLVYWFAMIALAEDFVYRMHSKWCKISKEKFHEIHYAGMMYFKLFVFIVNIVPYFALKICL